MMVRSLALAPDGTLLNRVFLDDARVARLLALLAQDGEDARIVGGAVRNALLGLPPGDIDVTTTAPPETVIARARAARLRCIPTGVAHGTVTVVVDRLPLEVTTLREDVETDGRHAVVRFGRDFEADAQRRDFTINAMSVDPQGHVFDYIGGLTDLEAGRVRFIGDANTRIREDYLRILRFFRFSASYATGVLDPSGLAAAVAEAGGIRRLSRERIRAEVGKLLVAPRAPDVVAAMGRASLLDLVVGRTCRPPRFSRYRAIETARNAAPDAILGLATLALGSEADAIALREALRLSNDERDRLVRLAVCVAQRGGSDQPPDAHAVSAILFAQGRRTACDAVTFLHAEGSAPPDHKGWQGAARFAHIADVPTLPVSGADIVARGVTRGPLVGQTLKALQALWIRAGFPQNPAALHVLLDAAIETARNELTLAHPDRMDS